MACANELIRVVPPPFVKVREEVYKPWGFTKAPQAMVVFWYGGKARIRAAVTYAGTVPVSRFNIQFLASCILRVSSQDIEGDVNPVNTMISGDFVYDARANAEQLSQALAKVISNANGYTVTLTFRWVKRPVIVFRGKWRPAPARFKCMATSSTEKRGAIMVPHLLLCSPMRSGLCWENP